MYMMCARLYTTCTSVHIRVHPCTCGKNHWIEVFYIFVRHGRSYDGLLQTHPVTSKVALCIALRHIGHSRILALIVSRKYVLDRTRLRRLIIEHKRT